MSDEMSAKGRNFLKHGSDVSSGSNVRRVIHVSSPSGLRLPYDRWRNMMAHSDGCDPNVVHLTDIKVTGFEAVNPQLNPDFQVTRVELLNPPFSGVNVVFGSHPEQDHLLTSPLVTVADGAMAQTRVTPRQPALPWLESAAAFIPKTIREPFLGDLREDLADMAAKGRSRTAIRWAAISQVFILMLRWAWSNGLLRALRGSGV